LQSEFYNFYDFIQVKVILKMYQLYCFQIFEVDQLIHIVEGNGEIMSVSLIRILVGVTILVKESMRAHSSGCRLLVQQLRRKIV